VNEVKKLVEIIRGLAEKGVKVMVWCDDAYFGLAYEDDIEKQSLFAYLADLHPNVLAAKIDGPTKEDFAWGFRCGFITFACKGMNDAQYDALVKKLMGVIRSSVSCASTPPQTLLLNAYRNPETENQKAEYRKILEKRYKLVKQFVTTHSSNEVEALPFNSGYFMSFHTKCNAEELRLKILHEKQIGTISIDESTLRVAFSSVDESKIDQVYSAIYAAAEEMK
jgi:aspartate/methionine/tyrosine aminotransferase